MDLEMTGLEPGRHVIVEIATLITDDNLELVAEGPDLVMGATKAQLAEMDPIVVDMHTRSGLLDLIESSTLTVTEAGVETMAFLNEHIASRWYSEGSLEDPVERIGRRSLFDTIVGTTHIDRIDRVQIRREEGVCLVESTIDCYIVVPAIPGCAASHSPNSARCIEYWRSGGAWLDLPVAVIVAQVPS